MKNRKKIIVLGGGTAGWLTALFINSKLNNLNVDVTLVESSSIGVLGAGEGATPHLTNMLEGLGISVTDLIKNAGATMKNGIKFTNWNNDGKHYYHIFHDYGDANPFTFFTYGGYPLIALDTIATGNDLDDSLLTSKLSESNKVKYVKRKDIKTQSPQIDDFYELGRSSVHFNARKLAVFLKKVGQQRGIRVVDATVHDFNILPDGSVGGVQLINENDKSFSVEPCDFIFDCSGFNKLLVGKVFMSPWKSYSDLLPVNRAIPFFIDYKEGESIAPYTESIAMKYGWMWKIPVEGRYGCGYVFDSSLITDDQAKEEIKQTLNKEIDFPTVFSFSSGYFEKPWNKNCLAIGLSSGFVEPLEATSIWTITKSLDDFIYHLDGFLNNSQYSIDSYNKKSCNFNEEIFNFVYLHYLSKRDDTEFWNKFKNFNKHPTTIKDYIKYSKEWLPWTNNFKLAERLFTEDSYLQVAFGLGHITSDTCFNVLKKLNIDFELLKTNRDYFNKNLEVNYFEDHGEFLNYLKS